MRNKIEIVVLPEDFDPSYSVERQFQRPNRCPLAKAIKRQMPQTKEVVVLITSCKLLIEGQFRVFKISSNWYEEKSDEIYASKEACSVILTES